MANKLPWFTHDHDAHEDLAIRSAIRKHGHVAGWVWWCTLELLHKHGSGDTLTMPLLDLATSMMVDKRTCKRVYQTLCEVRLITRASYERDTYTVCTVVIEKFRKRQSKLKFKVPSRLHQHSVKTPQEEEGEREGERVRNGVSQEAELFNLWNERRPSTLSEAKGMGPDRIKHAKARLAENPDMAWWESVIQKIHDCPFLLGSNDRGWKASLDFILSPGKAIKILEGAYDGCSDKSYDTEPALIQGDRGNHE